MLLNLRRSHGGRLTSQTDGASSTGQTSSLHLSLQFSEVVNMVFSVVGLGHIEPRVVGDVHRKILSLVVYLPMAAVFDKVQVMNREQLGLFSGNKGRLAQIRAIAITSSSSSILLSDQVVERLFVL